MRTLIDVNELKAAFDRHGNIGEDIYMILFEQEVVEAVPLEDYESMEQTVNKLTKALADADSVKHGHWTNINISVTGNSSAECSLCGTVIHDTFADVNRINYCPNCGAKMDDVEEDARINCL